MERKRLTKSQRKAVYEKYGGHCAYCGCELAINEMQVDHINSVYKKYYGERTGHVMPDVDIMDNYNPACRKCNFYKSAGDIESLRKKLGGIVGRLQKIFIFNLALKYGLIQITGNDIHFYCEQK